MGSLAARATLRGALRQGSKAFIRHGLEPAAAELNKQAFISLSITALRSIDPGFELVGRIGRQSLRQIIKAGRLLKDLIPVWKKALPGLEAQMRRRHPHPRIFADSSVTGPLTGLHKDAAAKNRHGANHKRQPIDIQIDHAAGGLFDIKVIVPPAGGMRAVTKPLAQRMKMILETGLSGRGAPRAAARLAVRRGGGVSSVRRSRPVRLNHLLRWLDNAHNANPISRREFINSLGLSENALSAYVSPAGALTASAHAMLAEAGMYDYNRLFTLSPELIMEVIQHLDIGPLQKLIRAFPPYANEHVRAVSLRAFAQERLCGLKQQYAIAWAQWLTGNFPGEKRWVAWERLNTYFDREHRQLIFRELLLSELPARLPNDILHFDISNNRLTRITTQLSESMLVLDVNTNFLYQLPAPLPPRLSMLDASHNMLLQVVTLQSRTLTFLDLSDNMLRTLPPPLA
ncbi:hypothetical protein ABK905_02735 [Acerihabitans sp. KWT182]|uniref:Leucine-rich repeat domain-containing protein n=1 Tax=Acerihabitans sp. KWT182 TaxID=3157919 RepID=A0AAU7QAX1_9GAMM